MKENKKNIFITVCTLFLLFGFFAFSRETKKEVKESIKEETKQDITPLENDTKEEVKEQAKDQEQTQKRDTKKAVSNPPQAPSKSEAADAKVVGSIIERLGKLMRLPNEEPLVASIVDVATLKKTQHFYDNARDGDTLVIFVKARKAIIYDGVRDLIINVGPLGGIK